MPKHQVVLADTAPRPDGSRFTHEELLEISRKINASSATHRSHPNPLPFFDPGYQVKAWVTTPTPGGPAVLYAEGYPSAEVKKSIDAMGGEFTFVVSVVRKEQGQ
jgi:hypothetical protein